MPPELNLRWIYHVIAIWDESDHVSAKYSPRLAEDFWSGYFTAFPEAKTCAETPGVIATGSPIFAAEKVQSFLHEGVFIPHKGKNKDLAIAKFCSTGFVDQDDRFHFLLDDLREMRLREGDPPMQASSAATVSLITSDLSSGMTQALKWTLNKTTAHRTNFAPLLLDQVAAQGNRRMVNAGLILGMELRKRFIRVERGGLLLNLQDLPIP